MMRLTDLLGSEVIDRDATRVGRVHDVRLIQDGPPLGTFGAAPRIQALIAGSPAVGVRLGFRPGDGRGPWIVAATFRRLHADLRLIPWELVAAVQEGTIRLRERDHDLQRDGGDAPAGARRLDAGLELLDRQIVDLDGLMAGNVDDLELTWRTGEGPPSVAAILAGPGALSRRLGGRLGRSIAAVHDRLRDRDLEGPARVDLGVVSSIGSDVRLSVGRGSLATMRAEGWVRDRVIGHIPGAGRSRV
jgi:sporulation protein YlmC with PRC-barrel domain